MIEVEKMSVELLEENKVIRIDDKCSTKSVYLEVRSHNFVCDQSHPLTCRLYKEVARSPYLAPYLKRRHFLFSKFDEGIQYDEESLYSIIPEAVSLFLK